MWRGVSSLYVYIYVWGGGSSPYSRPMKWTGNEWKTDEGVGTGNDLTTGSRSPPWSSGAGLDSNRGTCSTEHGLGTDCT